MFLILFREAFFWRQLPDQFSFEFYNLFVFVFLKNWIFVSIWGNSLEYQLVEQFSLTKKLLEQYMICKKIS